MSIEKGRERKREAGLVRGGQLREGFVHKEVRGAVLEGGSYHACQALFKDGLGDVGIDGGVQGGASAWRST